MASSAEVSVRHRALDGRRYELSGPLDLGLPGTSSVKVALRGQATELVSGVSGLAEDAAAALGVPGFDEELGFAGGTLRLGRAQRAEPGSRITEDILLVAWHGEKHCLLTHFYDTGTLAAVEALHALGVTEHEDGVEIRTGKDSALLAPASVVKEVPRLGLLELTSPASPQATRLPDWKGRATPSGELFADRLPNGEPYYVLAGDDLWATVLPLPGTDVAAVPALLGGFIARLVAG